MKRLQFDKFFNWSPCWREVPVSLVTWSLLCLSLLPCPIATCPLQCFSTGFSVNALQKSSGRWIQLKNDDLNCISDWSVPQLIDNLCGHRVGAGSRLTREEGEGLLFQCQSCIKGILRYHLDKTDSDLQRVLFEWPSVEGSATASVGNQLYPDT